MKKVFFIVLSLIISTWAVSDDYASLMDQGNRLWQKRDDQESLLSAISLFEKALLIRPLDEALLAKLCRAYYWKGMNLPEKEKNERMTAFQKGMDYGESLLSVNPESIPGNFWFASNKARLGAEKGILKSLSFIPDMRERVNFVLQNSPSYHYGAAQRFLAKLCENIPGMLRKRLTGYTLEEAEMLLKNAIIIEPSFAMSYIFLGDIYMTTGREALAEKEYLKVLEIPETALPECAAELRRDKKTASTQLMQLKDRQTIN